MQKIPARSSALTLAAAMFGQTPALAATCTVPNAIANGQVADASKVMDNFNAVTSCVDAADEAAVKPDGTPTTGSVAVFSGVKTVATGNLIPRCID